MRLLIKADGTQQPLPGPVSIDDVRALIGADSLDTVVLHHLGRPLKVMLVDDLGYHKSLPVNKEATLLYWANCRPGTSHQILGDVVVTLDDDYAGGGA